MKISYEGNDETAWVCVCGNTPHGTGFHPCDNDGYPCEPYANYLRVDDRWTRLYKCDGCGLVIDTEGEIKGRVISAIVPVKLTLAIPEEFGKEERAEFLSEQKTNRKENQ